MTMRSSIGVHRLPNDVSWVESSANGDTQRWTHWLPQRLSVIDRRACCLSKVRNRPLLRDETSACCPPTAGKPRPRRPLPSRAAVHISSPPTDQMAPADAPRAVAAAAAFSSPAHCPDACHSTVYHTPTSWCEGVTRAPPMAVTAAAALGARATSLAQSSRALPRQAAMSAAAAAVVAVGGQADWRAGDGVYHRVPAQPATAYPWMFVAR